MKHTPGEWIFNGHNKITDKAGEALIATVYGAAVEDQEGYSNAKLIAAAPELLEACKDGLENLTCLSNNAAIPPHRHCDCCGCASARVLQAAIAKATL